MQRPQPKVAAATASGAAATAIVFIAEQFGVDVTPEVAAAFATLLAFAGGYIKRNG